jgi:hypothetical protein
MRALYCALAVALSGCGQEVDHPDYAEGCEPRECLPPTPGTNGGGNEGGSDSAGEEVGTVSGDVVTFSTDFFDTGKVLTTGATVSAEGERGARVRGNYDGTTFQLEGVLKAAGNWFLVEPSSVGLLPTLTLQDTRGVTNETLSPGLAQSLTVDGIFALMGAERADARAQVVLRAVNDQGASVAGVRAEATAERIGYRAAGSWLASGEGTDDTGLIFLGNVQVASTLTELEVVLSGSASGRARVAAQPGAVTVATIIVSKK